MSQQNNGQNALLVENMLRKQEEYREGIRETHSLAKTMAGRFQPGGQIETLVGNDDVGEYKDRLKRLTQQNIQQERELNAFLTALQQVANQENIADYQAQVDSLMSRALEQIERQSLPMEQEDMYLEICSKLGEASAARRGGDEDEDLEVVEAPTTQVSTLKCPITQSFLEDPVKHVTCGHVFSQKAILNHIRGDRRCPVPGCATKNIQPDQLHPDAEIVRQVKRAKRQQEIQQKALSQQAIDADEEDEY
jgi:hypothetical protein